jgi:hypothetical protein
MMNNFKPDFTGILLSSPPLNSIDNLDSFHCSHPSVVAWHNFFVRKYPSLALTPIPLYCRPLYPTVSETNHVHAIDTSESAIDTWTTGVEAMGTLVSWIGRSMIGSSTKDDEEESALCAEHAITTFNALRPDLATAIESLVAGSIAHGFINNGAPFEDASKFLVDVLGELQRLSLRKDRYDVAAISLIDTNEWVADRWLPRVTIMGPEIQETLNLS